MRRNKIWTIFIGIVVITGVCFLIDYPTVPDWVPGYKWFSKPKIHLGLDLQGGTQLVYQTDTTNIPDNQRTDAIEGARDVIERRVNVFGVSEPLIQTAEAGDEWRLIVELPGIKDVHSAIEMIGETPILEFKEQAAARVLTDEEKTAINNYNKKAEERAQDILNQCLTGGDFSQLAKEYSEDQGSKEQGGDLGWFSKGSMVPEFENVVFNTLKKGEISPTLVKTVYGYHIIKKDDERVNNEGTAEVRASHILIAVESEELVSKLTEWQYTGLTGKQLKSSFVSFNSQTNEPEVSLEFDDEGAKLFAEITKRNINKPVAIFLDNEPLSIPEVKEEISGGKAVISGKFNLKEAKDLSERLSAGALPVPIKLVSQQNIGPSLGKISMQKSLIAGIIGFLVVIIYMIFFYRLRGVLVGVALMVYALILMSLFKLIPVTLTLAGIAGFVLSLGMAVDANVLIFERIKDEENLGKSKINAIKDGFKNAWSAIRDSNGTTLIICFILYQFGTGLVRGFGLTLGLGVLVSMFTAITVTKNFLELINKE